MKARILKRGNRLAIRLPKAALASLQAREGEPVDLVIEGDTLLVAAMRPADQPEILDDVSLPPMGDEVL